MIEILDFLFAVLFVILTNVGAVIIGIHAIFMDFSIVELIFAVIYIGNVIVLDYEIITDIIEYIKFQKDLKEKVKE